MFEMVEEKNEIGAVIKVFGVGGGGGNAVMHMLQSEVYGVEFICANTDEQALRTINADHTVLRIGTNVTKGLGAGANPTIGRQAALEDREQIAACLKGADMVFITAGMGGGTGTGAAPIVAQVARELGILTVAVVTRPFRFEGKKRMSVAEAGIKELQDSVDSLIIIPNERLISVLGKGCSLVNAFRSVNDVLKGAVKGISDLITCSGNINVDFADVRTVMTGMGMSMMGTGVARGDNRAQEAAEAAIRSPLLDNIDLKGARGILVNITAGNDLGLGEFTEIGDIVHGIADAEATVVIGTAINEDLDDEIKVTVVATGFNRASSAEADMKLISNQPSNGGQDIQLPQTFKKSSNEAVVDKPEKKSSSRDAGFNLDALDIPSFLRR